MSGDEFQLSSTMGSVCTGLGAQKTKEVIQRTRVKTTLVVCPTTLCQQWLGEIEKHSDLKVAVYEGDENFGTSLYRPVEDADEPEMMQESDFDLATLPEYDVVIVSFDTAQSELEAPLSSGGMELSAKALDRKPTGHDGPGLSMGDFKRALNPPLQQFEFWSNRR